MVRLYHTSLVVLVLALTCMGLNLSARGINSLTLSQDPILMLQSNRDVIKISTLGKDYSISRQANLRKARDLEDVALAGAWKSIKCMGKALITYSSLLQ